MKVYEAWRALSEIDRDPESHDAFWTTYFGKEKTAYDKILKEGRFELKGPLTEVADSLGLSPEEMAGFIDGVNTSLEDPVDLESLTEASDLDMVVLPEALYGNMLEAEADWLYGLPSWDGVLDEKTRETLKRDYNRSKTYVRPSEKVGRNDPCPCGSGKKYKKCCGRQQ